VGKQRSKQILGLDLLRAAAAILVLLFHYTFWNWYHNPDLVSRWPASYRRMAPYTQAGWVGVDIFFVISGFIITYSIERIAPAEFIRHRITRLLPSALICSTLTAFSYLWLHTIPASIVAWLWIRSVTFWPFQPWIDGSYWTLPVEISFYFLVLLCLSTRRTYLPLVMALLGITSTVWNFVLHQPRHVNLVFLLVHGCFFAFGVFFYELTARGFTFPRLLMLAVCLPGCLAEVITGHGLVPAAFWSAGICFLIASVLLNDRALALAGPKGAAIIRKIGLLTYPLYLVHDQAGNALIQWLHTTLKLNYGLALVLTIAAMTTLALLIVEYGEPPVKRAILAVYPKRFYTPPRTARSIPHLERSQSA
jgi:peptidoglycan/LPS O-acetylase OafA/YrhL